MTIKEAIVAACLIVLFCGAVIGIFSVKGCLGGADDPLDIADRRLQSMTDQLTKAHELWDAFERPEAVMHYKKIILRSNERRLTDEELPIELPPLLRSDERRLIDKEFPIVYRRVIEWEAEYGDPDSARDWCHRAKQEWPYRTRPISFSSDVAKQIWNEVTAKPNHSFP